MKMLITKKTKVVKMITTTITIFHPRQTRALMRYNDWQKRKALWSRQQKLKTVAMRATARRLFSFRSHKKMHSNNRLWLSLLDRLPHLLCKMVLKGVGKNVTIQMLSFTIADNATFNENLVGVLFRINTSFYIFVLFSFL